MKSFAYLFLLFFVPFVGNAQSAVASWEQIFTGETGYVVSHLNTIDGGVVLVTSTVDSVSGNTITSLIKSNINGNVNWTFRFGQTEYFVSNIVETADSSLLIAYTENAATDDQKEIHTLNLDANGIVLSTNVYRLPPQFITGTHAPGLVARNNGKYYLSSHAVDSISLLSYLHVIGLDSNGSVLWSNICDSATTRIDGTYIDTCANGDLFVATSGSIGVGTEICVDITRITSNGNMMWYKHLILPNYHLRIKSLVSTSTDSFYLVSSMYSPFTTLPELSVILVNGFGNVLWSQRYVPPGVPWYVLDAAIGEDNELVILGGIENSIFSDGSLVCMLSSSGQVMYGLYSPWFYYTTVDYRSAGLFSVAGSGGVAFENPVYVLLDSTLRGCGDVQFGFITLNQTLSYTSGFGSAPVSLQIYSDSLTQIAGTIVTNIHCPPVGVDEFTSTSIRIYPVPVQDKLTIEAEVIPDLIEVYDATGHLMYSSNNNSFQNTLDVATWPAGMYLVRVLNLTAGITRKILIE